ncbi:MAG TPA: hypothetical protein VF545_04615 [Thermoleophilaceae bacterium]
MHNGRLTLSTALVLAEAALREAPVRTEHDDPLRLEIPPVVGSDHPPSPEAVRALAALYLLAELEQAGVVPVAEALAAERVSLDARSVEAAARLERFARRSSEWYDRSQRALLFARLFGIGPSAGVDGGADVNHEFQERMAALCRELADAATAAGGPWRRDPRGYGSYGGGGYDSRGAAFVRRAALDVLANVTPRLRGSALVAGQRLQEQLREAIELLNDPAIGAPFGARGLWATVRAVLGDGTPDLGRLVDRGQAGQGVLLWLASALPRLATSTDLLAGSDEAVASANTWLQASGLGHSGQPAERAA